jgi:hypothetical protein
MTPFALPMCDFDQKKRMKRRASSREGARRFFCPKSRVVCWGKGEKLN